MGHSRKVAELLKEKLDADLVEIKPVKPYKDKPQYLIMGFQAMVKVKPLINTIDVMTTDYDLVILGSPTWNWRPTPPIRTFFSSYPIKGKLALYLTAGGNGIKAMKRFRTDVEKKTEVVSTFISQDSKEDTLEEELTKWADELKEKI